MTRLACYLALCLLASGCGIKRPLIAPRDIPAYEKKLEEKRQKHSDEPATQPQVMLQQGVAA